LDPNSERGGGGTLLPSLLLPRVTPTQVALLPPRPGDPELLAQIIAPLTWEASRSYTFLEWARYGRGNQIIPPRNRHAF
jgi:hypothetical protein